MDEEYLKHLFDTVYDGSYSEYLDTLNKKYEGHKMHKIKLKFENKSNNPDPEYAKIGDSGFDVRADLTEDVVLGPLERYLVPTGLSFELPSGFELQARSRSGNAYKYGVMVLNSPGTIDEFYRGTLQIILANLSNEPFTIKHGDRIAQCVLANVTGQRIVELDNVGDINKDTDRGTAGFGSTGIK